jgi:hypothetical protein
MKFDPISSWYDNQPTKEQIPENAQPDPANSDMPLKFPTDPAEGNDDPLIFGVTEEDSNPYAVKNGDDYAGNRLNHVVGQMTSMDGPSQSAYYKWAGTGKLLSKELNFQEFSRLELYDGMRSGGRFWFRISNYVEWHHYLDADYDPVTQNWKNKNSSFGATHPKP